MRSRIEEMKNDILPPPSLPFEDRFLIGGCMCDRHPELLSDGPVPFCGKERAIIYRESQPNS
jgi:hypothetical protein